MRTPNEIIDEIEKIRASNNGVWMRLVRLAWELDPETARSISAAITENDAKILECSRELAQINQDALDAQAAGYIGPKNAVLIPGGGVLHTYAVHEAKELGLVPIVTDRDKDCPGAKIPGVEFHHLDCYDTEGHARLAAAFKDRLVGAFCGGADTHVQVAAAAEVIGSTWVSMETALRCKDKLHAKQALIAAGVPTAPLVTNEAHTGYVVGKPRKGSGSRGVRRHLIQGGYFRPPVEEKYEILEELLQGPEQSVEILLHNLTTSTWINIVDRHFVWKDNQPLEVGHTNPTRLGKNEKTALYRLACEAARAVGAHVGFFKIDSIWTKDGPKVLECTPRLSGGYDSQVSTPLSSGRNLLRYGLQLACGLPLDETLLERRDRGSVTVIHRPELATRDVLAPLVEAAARQTGQPATSARTPR